MTGPVRRVIAALSGGVDSSVAALLLLKKGFEVEGIYMKNWDSNDETGVCSSKCDAEDAEWICRKLGIKFHFVNFTKEYWNHVFSEMLEDYSCGLTPNPDILCNKHIKFDSLFQYAINNLGGSALATGHYACISRDPLQSQSLDTGVHLMQPKDVIKDQTFFLSQISQSALQRTIFPLGNVTKKEVKKIANENGLSRIAKKKESMGICFIGNRNFSNFISQYISPSSGNFINIEDGAILGQHEGIHIWTVGQRCKLPGLRDPYYVVKKDIRTQDIFIAPGTDHSALYSNSFTCANSHWIHPNSRLKIKDNVHECYFRFQNTHALSKCKIIETANNKLLVRLDYYIRALTPGQFAVFYSNGECLGSARIESTGASLYELGYENNTNASLCKLTDEKLRMSKFC